MTKKFFTDESLYTLVSEIKGYTEDAVSTKADSSHNHNGIYYSKEEVDTSFYELNEGFSNVIYQMYGEDLTEEGAPTIRQIANDEATKATSGKADVGHSHSNYVPTSRKINNKALSSNISLTASDVGALPADTAIPSNLSDLTDDDTHRTVTDTEKATWNAKSNFSGNYNDLTNKPSIPSIDGLATEKYVDDIANTKANVSHTHTKAEVGLGNVDNTADSTKSVKYATGAGSATKATQDASGNVITTTYEKKVDADATEAALKELINGKADSSHGHAISEITNLQSSLDAKVPTSRTVNEKALTSNITLSASDVNAYTKTETDNKIDAHNVNTSAHNDIRVLITDITTKLNNFLNVNDETTDQLSEVLALINANKGTLESLTTSKVNVSDIIDNLTTSNASKVLSAKQGVAIKALIDALDAELDSHGHDISDVSGLQTALDGKAASSHGTHVSFDSTNKPKMDGTAAFGTSTKVARADHVHPIDTSRAAKTDFDDHTGDTTAHITSTERSNWNAAKTHADSAHAPSDAQKNQNAFSKIAVSGQTTVEAETTTDTLTLAAGSNVSITTNATSDTVTINANIPVATSSVLGGVKSGTDITVDSYGNVSVNDDSHNHIISNVDGLQSELDGKQDTITGGASTIASSNLTASRALVSNSSGKVAVSAVTSTELGYLDGVTSNVQDQLDGKADKTQAVYYIEGTGTTDTTNKVSTWTGTHSDIGSYYEGLMIAYKIGIAGSTTTTLNINNLGAVNVVRNATTAINTSFPVNSVVLLVYTLDGTTAYWKAHDYDANTRNSVGDYRKNGTKLYFVGTTSSDSSTSSSYATSYTNSLCYVGTDNCLYSNNEQVITDVGTSGTASDTLSHSDTFTAITGLTKSGADIIPTVTTYTLPASGNTDTKVTAVGNHYTPSKSKTVSASSTTAATWGSTDMVTGIEMDAAGHVTGVTSIQMPANPDTHHTANLITGASSTAKANAAATNGNVYMNLVENSTVRNAHNIVGTGSVTVTSDANGKVTVNGTDTNHYHTPTVAATASTTLTGSSGTSNQKIATGTGVSDMYIPVATASTAGATIVYPAASCTTFSSDYGTITPLAAQKAAKMFAVPRITSTDKAIARFDGTDGAIQNSKIIIEDVTNTKDTSKKAQVIAIPAEGNKKMVYGYCTDQVDGTSFIGGVFDKSATSYPYASGLAIGGTSGNLLWKGKRVLDANDLTTINADIAARPTTDKYHKTGSWSGLTYTATAVGGADELKFTIPTGTSSTTVSAGNHSHSSYAPKASPTFTGTPKAPTAAAGTNTTQIATTAFVKTAVDNAIGTAIAASY